MSQRSILIFGGSGKVAQQLTRQLASTTPPHVIHSLIRKESQVAPLRALGATPHVHDIESTSVPALTSLIRSLQPQPQAIVWAAGAGGGDPARTESVDHHGAIKAMDAAAEAGVKRFVLVSALDVRDKEKKGVPEWYNEDDVKTSDRLWSAIGAYMHAKLGADRELVVGNHRRGLRWTIVRPGRLTDDEGKGTVDAGRVHLGVPISRSDVASAVKECLEDEGTAGLAFDVLGGETPVKEAIKGVVHRRDDCFQDFI